ncbi:tetratricopeptide repeat protein [Nocardia sp. NPDC051321]|uniref:tetratricopeptide repeat protein n=1 Tax=Nocardia sp. NPDC051321 TaxID=3364323 RepID=UPI0037A78D59
MADGPQPATTPGGPPDSAAARQAFGRELKRWRMLRGKSQGELGKAVYVDKSVISRIENGQRPVAADFVAGCEQLLDAGGALFALAPTQGPAAVIRAVPLRELGLPPAPRLVGRESELSALVSTLASGQARPGSSQVCVVRGMPGVGKTALVLCAAHQLVSTFTDGCVYRDLGGDTTGLPPVRPEDLLEWLLRHLQVDVDVIPASLADSAALYRGRTRGKRMLLVLDNVRDIGQVMSVIPSDPGCAVIVATRHRLSSLDVVHSIDLSPLATTDARELLRKMVSSDDSTDEAGLDAAVAEIVQRCGNLPLAIHVAAGMYRRMPHRGLSGVRTQLDEAAGDIRALSDGVTSVAGILRTALAELDASERDLFRLLSVHPGRDFTAESAAALADVDLSGGQRLIDGLWDRHLLVAGRGRGYGMHDLLRELSADDAATLTETERGGALRRLLARYLGIAHAADILVAPHRNRTPLPDTVDAVAGDTRFGSPEKALGWFDGEEETLVALAHAARAAGQDEYCWHLAHILRGYFFHTRRCAPWIAVHEDALACALRRGDSWWEATTRNNLGLAFAMQHDLDRASRQYERALAIFTASGDDISASHTRGHQAWIHHLRKEYAAAIDTARAALTVYQREGMRRNAAIMMRELGGSLAALDLTAEAAGQLGAAIAEFRVLGLDLDLSMALSSLAAISLRSGDPVEAVAHFEEAVAVAHACGSGIQEVAALQGLGDAELVIGRSEVATAHWSAALALVDELDLPGGGDLRRRLGGNRVSGE